MFTNQFRYPMLFGWLFSWSVSMSAQTNLYVSTTGNDATGTGLQAAPFATIGKAAQIASNNIATNPNMPVCIVVKGGEYKNTGFTTTNTLSDADYNPQTVGERIWKTDATTGTTIRLNNINGAPNAWITIKPATGEAVTILGDGDITFNIRSSSYIRVQGFQIKGIA
jgi:hypothetical protein